MGRAAVAKPCMITTSSVLVFLHNNAAPCMSACRRPVDLLTALTYLESNSNIVRMNEASFRCQRSRLSKKVSSESLFHTAKKAASVRQIHVQRSHALTDGVVSV